MRGWLAQHAFPNAYRLRGREWRIPRADIEDESTQGFHGGRFKLAATGQPGHMRFLAEGQVYRYLLEEDRVEFADMRPFQNLTRFYQPRPRLLIRRVVNRQDRLMATLTDAELVTKKDINPFVITGAGWDPHYLLAILNSALISFLYVNSSTIATKDDFRQTTLAELRRLPIPSYHANDLRHRRLSELAARMLSISLKLRAAGTEHERAVQAAQADAVDRAIDSLVCELYGLTNEETALIAAFRR